VYSWGKASFFALGNKNEDKDEYLPYSVKEFQNGNIVKVASGGFYSMCLTNDGNIFGFGNNKKGRLGIQGQEKIVIPTQIKTVSNIVDV
jgi:alpha-tubulin suppressor-like RCC1 family protein